MGNNSFVNSLASSVEVYELNTLSKLAMVRRLRAVTSQPGLVKEFGRLFHPIRYSFVHVNFIVGARQEMHEIFWTGLARNLFEESGGGETPAHNEFYRRFLRSIGVASDRGIREVAFSRLFNERWRNFARDSSIENAVLAIAIYEILDRPDYKSLYDALIGIDQSWDLEFFRLHSVVEHFGMFSEFVGWYFSNVDQPQRNFDAVKEFVLDTQRDMWIGLLEGLEHFNEVEKNNMTVPNFASQLIAG